MLLEELSGVQSDIMGLSEVKTPQEGFMELNKWAYSVLSWALGKEGV